MPLPTSFPTSISHFQFARILDQIQMPHHFPEQGDVLSFCFKMGPGEAALFLMAGVIILLFGINVFKGVVMINAAIVGAVAGTFFGAKGGNETVGAVIGGFTAAVISWPLMKHAVAIMGFAIGSLVGASLWRVFSLHPDFFWAGGMMGGITFGLLSFLLFRGCVMMYTSLQGASMAIFGILSLVMKYQDLAPKLIQYLSAKTFILPIAIFIPTLCGLIFQQTPSAAAAKPVVKK